MVCTRSAVLILSIASLIAGISASFSYSLIVFCGSSLRAIYVLCGYRYIAVDCAVHRRERRAVVRRRPKVVDKPCRDFQTFGVIKGQCPGIIFLFVFHSKCSKWFNRVRPFCICFTVYVCYTFIIAAFSTSASWTGPMFNHVNHVNPV